MLSEGGEGVVSHDVAPAMYGTYAVSVLVLQKNYFEKSVSARAFFFSMVQYDDFTCKRGTRTAGGGLLVGIGR